MQTTKQVRDATFRCESCGNDLRPKARFCDVCGSPLAARAASSERKQVTVLFADVVGSMKLAAALDAERFQGIMNELLNRAGGVVQRYHGTVRFTGDGFMALFGAPVALEDHALRACIAALEIHAVTKELSAEVQGRDGVALHLRIGLNSGEVIAGQIAAGRYTAIGHPVGMAQRMETAAPVDGVLCSLSTAQLVEEAARLGPVHEIAIKGSDVPVPARCLLGVELDRMVVARNESVMLGRDAELSSLLHVSAANRGCLVGVVGPPGVGKSRLISEFSALSAVREGEVVITRCEAHTTALAFRALSRLLREMFKVEKLSAAEARERTLAALPSPHSADELILFETMGIADTAAPQLEVSADGRRRRLIEVMLQAVLARQRRVLFVLEDAHWIDAPSDEILGEFAARLGTTPSMFVAIYRPEYRGALRQHAQRLITLQPLTDSITARLVGQILGDDAALNPLAERIAAAAAGNPFFVEEIVRDLAGRGLLSGSRGGYHLVGDVDHIAVPATVHAVLAARIDRLPLHAKTILNAAAVIGTQFDVEMLELLVSDVASGGLSELVSAELIDQTEFIPRQAYRFRHPLVRTVAYESQLSADRAQTHRKLAAAIEARDPDLADENAALIARHLEAAGELGRAHRWYMRAAEWLRSRDLAAARAEWESARRIADRLPDDEAGVLAMRIAPRTMLISTALYVGDDLDADKRYREFRDLTLQAGDLKSLAIAMAGRIMSFTLNDNRVPEAAVLAAELEETVTEIECDAGTRSILLISVAVAMFTNCEFDDALRVIDAILGLSFDEPTMEIAGANTLRGYIEICRGDHEQGRAHIKEGVGQARELHPANYTILLNLWATLVVLGFYKPGDLVVELRDALGRAEAFGDISAIITAQCAYGSVLLRAERASHEEAIDVLKHAHGNIEKYQVSSLWLAIIEADLAVDAAHAGREDEAIDQLRKSFLLHTSRGFRVFAGCTGEALVKLLIQRGSVDDIAEAHRIVFEGSAVRPGIPAMDLWWLKSRALLAKKRNTEAYMQLATQYLELCEKLDARERLNEARQMVSQTG